MTHSGLASMLSGLVENVVLDDHFGFSADYLRRWAVGRGGTGMLQLYTYGYSIRVEY